MTSDAELVDAQHDAARVASRSEIREVRLLDSKAHLEQIPSSGNVLIYGMQIDSTVEREEDDDTFVVRFSCVVNISEQQDEEASPSDETGESDADSAAIARIEFEYAALYSLDIRQEDDPFKPEEFQAFAKTTGQFALYPFAREYIYDMTGRLALPPLTVGLLRMPAARPAER